MEDLNIEQAIQAIKQRIESASLSPEVTNIIEARNEVINKYGLAFKSDNVALIGPETIRDFLLFSNNKHWSGLHRQSSRITSNPTRMRDALGVLLNESARVDQRLDTVLGFKIGIGPGIATAILTVAFPEKYGVWNNPSEQAMRNLQIWPERNQKESPGKQYLRINRMLQSICERTGLDFWRLDAIWWEILATDRIEQVDAVADLPSELEDPQLDTFRLEKQLKDFLLDNWENTILGSSWEILQDLGGEIRGNEFPTDVGRIDILAKHKTEKRLLVVELKRNQTSDQTLGQIQRYMGWLQQNLNKVDADGYSVEGLIICSEADARLKYAHSVTRNIGLKSYRIDFKLEDIH